MPEEECLEAAKEVYEFNPGLGDKVNIGTWTHTPCGCFLWGDDPKINYRPWYSGCIGDWDWGSNRGVVCKKSQARVSETYIYPTNLPASEFPGSTTDSLPDGDWELRDDGGEVVYTYPYSVNTSTSACIESKHTEYGYRALQSCDASMDRTFLYVLCLFATIELLVKAHSIVILSAGFL